MTIVRTVSVLSCLALLAGCGSDSSLCSNVASPCVGFPSGTSEKDIAAAFAQAKPSTTLIFDSGTFQFTNTLNLAGVSGVTVKGQGMDKTLLDFKGQKAGADGILAEHTDQVTFSDFWVRDPVSSGVRVNQGRGVTMQRLKVSWTTADLASHGAYGLYPVLSRDVLLEDSEVSGASDSGICASQLDHGVVRRNTMTGNPAGIIVRNGYFLDVLDNDVHDNSVGIVIGTLPGDDQLNGHDIRVASNRILHNNAPGLNRPDALVDRIPSGAGLVVVGNDRMEIFGNTIDSNQTSAISVVSLFFAQIPPEEGIDPFPSNVYVHDNTLTGNGAAPDLNKALGLLLASGAPVWESCCGGHVPDIFIDGFVNPDSGSGSNPMNLCVRKGSATFGNLHADQLDPEMDNLADVADSDVSPYDCTQPALPAVSVPGA
jgi:parallel beta-helix repeat protein